MNVPKMVRREPPGRTQPGDSPLRGASPLLQRLMDKVARQRQERERERARRTSPPPPPSPAASPPGGRSGHGSDSVAPYLEETRNSRPAPLD